MPDQALTASQEIMWSLAIEWASRMKLPQPELARVLASPGANRDAVVILAVVTRRLREAAALRAELGNVDGCRALEQAAEELER